MTVFYVVVCNGKFLKSLEIPLSANISAYKFINNTLRLIKNVKFKGGKKSEMRVRL
jgi:hypothetical protein